MRVARVLVSTDLAGSDAEGAMEAARPRVALVRDDAVYDVASLEEAFGVAIDRGDPSDFQTRVATLRCAGLYDLDARLLRGERPTAARIPNDRAVLLAPCDTERAALVHVDARLVARGAPVVCRIGQARSLVGQDGFAGVPEGALRLEVSLAAVLGDDLRAADARQAAAAIMGYALFVDWVAGAPSVDGLATLRGVSAALGPTLVSRYALPKLGEARATIRAGGEAVVSGAFAELPGSMADALSRASREVELRSGDVVAFGPLPGAAELPARAHERVEVIVDGLGTLRGVAVPRR